MQIPENVTDNFRVGFFQAKIVVGISSEVESQNRDVPEPANFCEHIFGFFVIYIFLFDATDFSQIPI